jgi:CRP-like cAMP-binding protein
MTIEVQRFKALFPSIAKHCDKNDLDSLLNAMTTQSVSAGSVVVNEDDVTGNLYFVLEGELTTSVKGASSSIDLGTLKAGDTFCMANLMDPGPANMTVTALSDTKLMVLSNESFRQLEGEHLNMTGNILRMLSNELIEICRNADRMLFNRSAGIADESEHHKQSGLRDWATNVYKKLHG